MSIENFGAGSEKEKSGSNEEQLEKAKQQFFDHINFFIKYGEDIDGNSPLEADKELLEEYPDEPPIYGSHQIYEISPSEDLMLRVVDNFPIKELHFPIYDFEVKIVSKKGAQYISETFDVNKEGRVCISLSVEDHSLAGKEFRKQRARAYKKAGKKLNDAIMMDWILKERQQFGGFPFRPATVEEVNRINDALQKARDSRPWKIAEAEVEQAPITEETKTRIIERIDELMGPLSEKDLMYGEGDDNADLRVGFVVEDSNKPGKIKAYFSLYVHGNLLPNGKVFIDERKVYLGSDRRKDGLYEQVVITFDDENATERVDLHSDDDYKEATDQVEKIMDGTMSMDEFVKMMRSHDASMATDEISENPLREIMGRYVLSLLKNPREIRRTHRSNEDP